MKKLNGLCLLRQMFSAYFQANKFLRLKYLQKHCKNTSVVLGTNSFQRHYLTISFLGKHYKH